MLNILQLNAQSNTFELDIFIEYIKLPLANNKDIYNLSDESKEKIDNYLDILGNSNPENFFTFNSLVYEEKEIIEKHLKHFYLKEKIDFNKFNKHFKENYIKNL